MSHVAWPEIESFHNVRKSVQKFPELLGGRTTVEYRAKVKLHGRNGAVQVRGDRVMAQSRTEFVAGDGDNDQMRSSAPAQIDPMVAANVDGYAAMVLTEARLEQGARAAAGGELSFEKRLIGPFLVWICKDVEKETVAEREASGLAWKQVQKAVSDRAREWYLKNAERIA